MKNKLLTATAVGLVLFSSTASNAADDATQKQLAALQTQIKQLQEQLNLLQRKQEVTEEVTKGKEEKNATVEYGNKGLNITSPDKRYSLKVGGFVQADARVFNNSGSAAGTDQFLIRSARPNFEAKLPGGFSSRLQLDFGNGQSRTTDAYLDWKYNDAANLRAGKFKIPLGLERWQGETDTLFVERGLTTDLVPFREIGIGAFGEIIPQTLEYQFGIANGVADLADPNTSNGDSSGGKDFYARLFTQPFKNTDYTWLQGFGVGLAGSVGQRDGNATTSELSAGYKTTSQNNFFTYTPATGTVFANGENNRINPQAWYYNGPLSVLAEYVSETGDVSKSTAPAVKTSLTNTAWTAIVTYVLTGEDAAFNTVKPAHDFNPEKGYWGAWELAGRYGELDVDDKTFPTYSNLTSSAKSITERVLGLNWYPNQNVKFNFDYAINSFEGGAVGRDRPDENVFLARAQFKF